MKVVEIFRTDVRDKNQTVPVLQLLQHQFPTYRANFDLDDCDNILRLETREEVIQQQHVIILLQQLGYKAEVLPG